MLFTTHEFFVFFLIVLVSYWLLAKQKVAQNVLLLGSSYFFYGFVNPIFCLLLLASTLIDFICGAALGARKGSRNAWVIISIATNLSILGVFKYFNFFVANIHEMLNLIGLEISSPQFLEIAVPVGISFYTFQSMSYTIDVYRGVQKPVFRFPDFALYVAFFPQLVAGPIERARTLIPQITERRIISFEQVASGIEKIIYGLVLKLAVANNVATYVDRIFMLEAPSIEVMVVGALGFAIQIYADFFGYTLMALGIASLLGFRLSRNFNSPYFAWSPSEFWRRWHISLSSFVRDYLYIPLGGSQRGAVRTFVALTITMFLMGLWHGAAWKYVVWGLYHGFLLALYHLAGLGGNWRPKSSRMLVAWPIWFCFMLFGWLIFRAPDVAWLVSGISSGRIFQETHRGVVYLSLLSIGFYSLPFCFKAIADRLVYWSPFFRGITSGVWVLWIVLVSADATRAFIYFRF